MTRCAVKFGGLLSAFATLVTGISVNRMCYFIFGQDEVPAGAKRLRKF